MRRVFSPEDGYAEGRSVRGRARPGSLALVTTLSLVVGRAVGLIFLSVCALVECVVRLPFAPRERRPTTRAAWLHRWCGVARRLLGVQIDVRGPVPRSGLLVCNHLSYLDIIALSALGPCVFVAKREVSAWPLFGLLARGAGSLFIERRSRGDTLRVAQAMARRLRAGQLVVLFPEGTSSGGASVLPFRSSLFAAVARLDCKITAAALDYTIEDGSAAEEVCYWKDMTLFPHVLHLFRIRCIRLRVAFCQPATTRAHRKILARELHCAVEALKAGLSPVKVGADGRLSGSQAGA